MNTDAIRDIAAWHETHAEMLAAGALPAQLAPAPEEAAKHLAWASELRDVLLVENAWRDHKATAPAAARA